MINASIENDNLVIAIEGTVTSDNAHQVEAQIRNAGEEYPTLPLVLDADRLSYISSAGLRILLALSKKYGQKLTMRNVSPEIYETLEITGFTKLINVRKRLREISIDGCPVIGRGAIGTVYRLDADTVVKVYELPDCLPMIENEQQRAKQAFIRGIPTAISYDIVRVGKKYGSVFEMVRAENCNNLIVREPERREELTRVYVQLLHSVHDVVMQPGELPDARDIFNGYIDALKEILPQHMAGQISQLIKAMPENLHAVHGDIQMKNVMLSDAEPLLIDMETLCSGDPVFDFAGLFVAYCAFTEDEPTNAMDFLGLETETCRALYRRILSLYLGEPDEPTLISAEARIEVLGYLRFLYIISVRNLGKEELKDIRIRHTLENISRLLKQVDRLTLA